MEPIDQELEEGELELPSQPMMLKTISAMQPRIQLRSKHGSRHQLRNRSFQLFPLADETVR